jgi:hypothetical protein
VPAFRPAPPLRLAALLALGVFLAACRDRGGALPVERRVPLADTVPAPSTLAVDAQGRAWIGRPGRIDVADSLGRVSARIPVPGDEAPRWAWSLGGRPYARAGGRLLRLDPDSGRVAASRAVAAPAVPGKRGRWVYTATRSGSVLGLDPATLEPRWGWPDAGSRVGGIALSPLGERVYVALEGGANGVDPSIEVRDARDGRLLSTFATDDPVLALEAGPDGTLYALFEGRVEALRHGSGGLARGWTATGLRRAGTLRVSPDGRRLAVLARGDEGEMWLLDARTGAVRSHSAEAPRDAAFDVGGRLWVLHAGEIRLVR